MNSTATLLTPRTRDEAVALLAECARREQTVSVQGGGTKLGLGYPLESCDVVVRTTGLSRIVDYAPADQVITVEAGIAPADLAAVLAENGQRLACDAPDAERATLGGLLATNDFGPLRTRYGSLRDVTLGIELVRADGARVHGGGKVVKNVAGFDLPKLAIGSLGTLGAILSATFRVHPLPEQSVWLRTSAAEAGVVAEQCRLLLEAQLEPCAVLALRTDSGFEGYVCFDGFAESVAAEAERWQRAAAGLGLVAQALDAEQAGMLERAHAGARRGALALKITSPSARFAESVRTALAPLCGALGGVRCAAYPLLGIAFVASDDCDALHATLAITLARETIERSGGSLVVTEAPAAVRAHVDVWGALPPAFALMRTLKERFDPQRRLNRGRFVGGL